MKTKDKYIVAVLILLILIGVSAYAYIKQVGSNKMQQETKMMLATDLHYLSPKLTDHGSFFEYFITNSDGKVMEYSEELMETFVDSVIKEKPQVLILTGDLTYNGAAQSHKDLTVKLQRIADAGIPVLVIPGNHDINSSNAASFEGEGCSRVDSITAEEFSKLYGPFGYEDAFSYDTASLSYVWELSPTLRFIMLDVNGVESIGKVPKQTLQWLEQQLKEAKEDGVQVLAFSHQNLLQQSIFKDGYVIQNSEEVIGLYRKYNVSINFSGHIHVQHSMAEGTFTEVTTSALSVATNQLAKIYFNGTKLRYETQSVNVSEWAIAAENNNTDLLDFSTYSREFFIESGYQKSMKNLNDIDNANNLAKYFATLNYFYFSGRLDEVIIHQEYIDQWKELSFVTGLYMDSISKEIGNNYNSLEMDLLY